MNRPSLVVLPLLLSCALGCRSAEPSYSLEPSLPQGEAQEERSADWKAVEAACLDYVEGIYGVDPARIERSVDPKLVKLGFWRRSPEDEFSQVGMTYEQLHDLAGSYNVDGRVPEDAPKEVTVLDVLDQTASAKLVASWGVDYFHLGKIEGRWKILQVLWQQPPAKD